MIGQLKCSSFVVFFSMHALSGFTQLVWTAQSSGTTLDIESLDFISPDVGWTVEGTNGTSRTTDGGTNWNNGFISGANDMFGVDFANATQGWAVDNYSSVFYTGDGGSTWVPQYTNSSALFALEIFFLNNQNGWVARQDYVMFTDDGGSTWDSSAYPMSWAPYDVEFATPDVGYIMGLANSIAKSTDGGITWTEKIVDLSGSFYGSFDVVNENTIYVVGQMGLIFFSQDGGDTWVQQTSGISSLTLLDVNFYDLNHGIIVGEQGIILTTTDGGANWILNSSGTSTQLRGVKMVSPTVAYAVGYGGVILKSQALPNDLVIDIYSGSNTACAGDLVDVPVTIKNLQAGELTSGNFVITNSIGDIVLNEPWTGSLPGYQTADIVIGQMVVDESNVYTISFTGDSVTTNNTYDFYINVYDHATVGVDGPHITCPGDSLTITATGGQYYEWLSLTAADTLETVTVAPTVDTYYPVKIYYQNVCKWIDTVYVSIDNSCGYNNLAFSPNGDGVNDYLHIEGAETVSNILYIYNRWGDEIISFTNYNNTDVLWYGENNKGNDLEEGTYFYVFDTGGNLINGIDNSKSGWVQIVR